MRSHHIPGTDACMRYHDLPGEGPALLFVHGLGCASSHDYPQVACDPALAGRRRILVDLPGSGYSDKPEGLEYGVAAQAGYLCTLVEALGLGEYDVYGHSMGGSVAIELAARCAAPPRALVVSEANLDPGGGEFSGRIAAFGEREYRARGHDVFIEVARCNGGAAWAARLAAGSAEAVHAGAASLVRGGEPSWREMLAGLPMPKAFLFGEYSLPDPDFEALRADGVHVAMVPGAGHSMAWENPSGLARAIAAALPRGG